MKITQGKETIYFPHYTQSLRMNKEFNERLDLKFSVFMNFSLTKLNIDEIFFYD